MAGSSNSLLAHLEKFRWFNPLPDQVRAFLRSAGGAYNIVGDHELEAVPYFWQAPEGRIVFISELIVLIRDATLTWAANKYGAVTLTNGYSIRIMNGDEVVHDVCDGVPIKTNTDLSSHCHRTIHPIVETGTIDALGALFAFGESGVPLELQPGHRIEIVAHDDFSGLDVHTMKIVGCAYQVEADGRVQPPVPQP